MPLTLFDTQHEGNTLIVKALENVNGLASYNIKSEADALVEQWTQHGLKHVVVDLENAEYFGTYMLELIHSVWRHVRPAHGKMAVFHVSDIGREVLHMARLDTLWPICASREDALRLVEGSRESQSPAGED